MSKLRLKLKSTAVADPQGDVHAMIDVACNGTTLEENIQLSASEITRTWDATINAGSNNAIVINVTNALAYDVDESGDFNGEGEVVSAKITSIEYSTDDVNYTSILPQAEVTHVIPGGANVGTTITLRPALDSILMADTNSNTINFTTADGLVNSTHYMAVQASIDGDGNYFDQNGDPLDN